MPTRILREGILTSERVNRLSQGAELFYRRLMSVADDHGRYFAHPALLRAACYPLQLEKVREANIERYLQECEVARLVRLYHDHGAKYLAILDFRQQTRGVSKYPDPPPEGVEPDLLSNCLANANQSVSNSGLAPHTDTSPPSSSTGGMQGGFQKPTMPEMELHASKLGLPPTEINHFYDFYESKGWFVGRNPMRDWRRAMNNWKRNYDERRYTSSRSNVGTAGRNSADNPRNVGIVRGPTDYGEAAKRKLEKQRAASGGLAGQVATNANNAPASGGNAAPGV